MQICRECRRMAAVENNVFTNADGMAAVEPNWARHDSYSRCVMEGKTI
jgi:hypothetical protein